MSGLDEAIGKISESCESLSEALDMLTKVDFAEVFPDKALEIDRLRECYKRNTAILEKLDKFGHLSPMFKAEWDKAKVSNQNDLFEFGGANAEVCS